MKVDEDLGTIHVTRVVTAIAGGRILNPKTARSQVLGAIVWGIGTALEEESVIDHAFGRFMTHNLADYHVPVNADVHDIEVIFVEERDEVVNPLGAKGLGEIGVVGVAAAIANAVFHATGKRIRELADHPRQVAVRAEASSAADFLPFGPFCFDVPQGTPAQPGPRSASLSTKIRLGPGSGWGDGVICGIQWASGLMRGMP